MWTGTAGEDPRPVHRVEIAQLLVPRDVHAAVIYVTQRAQPQGCQGGDLHHQKSVAPENMSSENE